MLWSASCKFYCSLPASTSSFIPPCFLFLLSLPSLPYLLPSLTFFPPSPPSLTSLSHLPPSPPSLLALSQASLLSVPSFGRVDIIPRHNIILDRTNCTNATVTPPPTETTPTLPSNASDTCLAIYRIVRGNTSEPFVCRLSEGCDGFWCRLDILNTYYNITLQVNPSYPDLWGERLKRKRIMTVTLEIYSTHPLL